MSIVSNQTEAVDQAKKILFRSQIININNFADFVLHTKQNYTMNWHHRYICNILDDFISGKIKRLMLFTPPQHGKSELVSRRLPAYMLGKNPNLKFVGASYSSDLSSSFNRDIQRIIDSPEYQRVFPDVYLNRSNIRTTAQGSWLRNSDIFEIVGHTGSYKSVGVGGSLTGNPADVLGIDDPVKDLMEANSITTRNSIWDWYLSVAETRLHNDSQVLLTMTRWHEDDLAGRILNAEPGVWKVIILPALKEDNENPDDPRQIGEALWEGKHSKERIEAIRDKSAKIFTSMYQQRPAPEEGDIFKAKWFKTFKASELPEGITRNFRSDTAYGKEQSDNSSTFCYSTHEGGIYIWSRLKVNLSFPEFIKAYKTFIFVNGYTGSSQCIFEPKATGISTVQQLKAEQLKDGQFINVVEDKPPKDGKETRAKSVSPIVESGRVYFLEGAAWIEDCLSEIKSFPNGKFDDDVDNLVGIIEREILNSANVNMAFF